MMDTEEEKRDGKMSLEISLTFGDVEMSRWK